MNGSVSIVFYFSSNRVSMNGMMVESTLVNGNCNSQMELASTCGLMENSTLANIEMIRKKVMVSISYLMEESTRDGGIKVNNMAQVLINSKMVSRLNH